MDWVESHQLLNAIHQVCWETSCLGPSRLQWCFLVSRQHNYYINLRSTWKALFALNPFLDSKENKTVQHTIPCLTFNGDDLANSQPLTARSLTMIICRVASWQPQSGSSCRRFEKKHLSQKYIEICSLHKHSRPTIPSTVAFTGIVRIQTVGASFDWQKPQGMIGSYRTSFGRLWL